MCSRPRDDCADATRQKYKNHALDEMVETKTTKKVRTRFVYSIMIVLVFSRGILPSMGWEVTQTAVLCIER